MSHGHNIHVPIFTPLYIPSTAVVGSKLRESQTCCCATATCCESSTSCEIDFLLIYIYICNIPYIMRLALKNWYESHPQMPSDWFPCRRPPSRKSGRLTMSGRPDESVAHVVALCCEGEGHILIGKSNPKKMETSGSVFCLRLDFTFISFWGLM